MTKEDILNKAHSLSEKAEVVGKIMPKSSIIAASIDMAEWILNNLWKPADGNDLPEIDREVIALVGLEGFFEIPPDEPVKLSYKVVFAHRPPEYWNGKNILTGEVTRHYTKRYDKGGWNIPNVKYWLDVELPKEMGL